MLMSAALLGGIIAVSANRYIEHKERIAHGFQNKYTPAQFVGYSNGKNLPDFTEAAEMTVHAVVHVKTTYQQSSNANQFYLWDPFGFGNSEYYERPRPQEATGSGVIISDDGYVVTNNHVVDNADMIEITLNDKRKYVAKVIGTDPTTDLALLKIDQNDLPYIAFGDSDSLKIGEWVLAVGNPFNLTSTVTAGIISAKGRSLNILGGGTSIESYIQTDAAVNPGNSGGALVNTRGELIGINAAIASNTGSYAGYSFAIPVTIVKKVTNDLLKYGEVQRAFLGVRLRDLDAKLANEKGIKNIEGVYIEGVNIGGAAEKAGVLNGDIITKIGEIKTNNVPELQEQVSRYKPGDKIPVTIKRDNIEMVVQIEVKNKYGDTNIVSKDKVSETATLMGASFETMAKEDLGKLGIQNGIKIAKLEGGKFRSAGIREGFIVTYIDKKTISSINDVLKALENKKGGVLIEGVYPNGMRAYYGFGI